MVILVAGGIIERISFILSLHVKSATVMSGCYSRSGTSCRSCVMSTMDPASKSKPTVLIVRDKQEWPTDEFLTLLEEEGYRTIEGDENSLTAALGPGEAFGAIGKARSRQH